MYSEILTALSGIKTMTDLTALVLNAKVDIAVTEKAIESQSALLSLQSAMLGLQSQYQILLGENEMLKKQLIGIETWDDESKNYNLSEITTGVFAYAFKGDESKTIPAHWLCAHCFQNKQKSIIQLDEKSTDGASYVCPRCKTVIHDPTNRFSISFAATRTPKLTGF